MTSPRDGYTFTWRQIYPEDAPAYGSPMVTPDHLEDRSGAKLRETYQEER